MSNARRSRSPQIELPLVRPGGRRPGAGRKPAGPRRRTPHRARPRLTRHEPAHVTLRLAEGLPSLRDDRTMAVIRDAFGAARGRNGLRVTDHSVQQNHPHLVVEADDNMSLSRGMQGLAVRLARALNRLWCRKGRVFGDRYHAHVTRSPREVRHVLAYVLLNGRKHAASRGRTLPPTWLDPYSSALAFEGWRDRVPLETAADAGCAVPRSWLRRHGWTRAGPLDPAAVPGR